MVEVILICCCTGVIFGLFAFSFLLIAGERFCCMLQEDGKLPTELPKVGPPPPPPCGRV